MKNRLLCVFFLSLALLQFAAAKVQIGKNREFLLEGKPFIPLLVWVQPPKMISYWKDLGVNTLVWSGDPTAKDFLDGLGEQGMHGILEYKDKTSDLKGHPALLFWLAGSPDHGRENIIPPEQWKERCDKIKKEDPDNKTFAYFANFGFLQGIEKFDRSNYAKYSENTDILGFSFYPITTWGRPEWIPRTAESVDLIKGYSNNSKPIVAFVEATSILPNISREKLKELGHPDGAKDFEFTNMVWQALVHGAGAIGYFTVSWGPWRWDSSTAEIKKAMKTNNELITKLTPVLCAAEVAGKVEKKEQNGGQVDIMVKEFEGKSYIFAVNMKNNGEKVRFAVSGLKKNTKITANENRELSSEEGYFEDTFAGYGVNIYTIQDSK